MWEKLCTGMGTDGVGMRIESCPRAALYLWPIKSLEFNELQNFDTIAEGVQDIDHVEEILWMHRSSLPGNKLVAVNEAQNSGTHIFLFVPVQMVDVLNTSDWNLHNSVFALHLKWPAFRLAASVSWCWSWEKGGESSWSGPWHLGCTSEVFHVHSY